MTLKEKLEDLKEQGRTPLVCLGNSDRAKADWLLAGGTEGRLLTEKQVEAFLLTGASLPKELAFAGNLSEFIRLFPKKEAEESKKKVNRFLEQGVAEWREDGWVFYTCRTAVVGCCVGEYLSVVNQKDL